MPTGLYIPALMDDELYDTLASSGLSPSQLGDRPSSTGYSHRRLHNQSLYWSSAIRQQPGTSSVVHQQHGGRTNTRGNDPPAWNPAPQRPTPILPIHQQDAVVLPTWNPAIQQPPAPIRFGHEQSAWQIKHRRPDQFLDPNYMPYDTIKRQKAYREALSIDRYRQQRHQEQEYRLTGADCGSCGASLGMISRGSDFEGHHSFEYLCRSAQLGCKSCKLVRACVNDNRSYDKNRDSEARIVDDVLEFKLHDGGGNKVLRFELLHSVFSPDEQRLRVLEANPLSRRNVELVKDWVKECCEAHSSCGSVLDVSEERVRLLNASLITPVAQVPDHRYTALSHRWGTMAGKSTTTTTNVSALCKGIPFHMFPPTFRDAIEATKLLGVRYLWIDSLCIVQDSPEDWARECQNMGSYYRDSWLTLAALDSNCSWERFLADRAAPRTVEMRRAHWSTPSPPVDVLTMRRQPPDRKHIFQYAALNSRGWVLQERLLATRVLNYSRSGLYWECQTCSRQETSTIEDRSRVSLADLVTSEGADFKRVLALHTGAAISTKTEFMLWKHLVRQATKRELTFVEDKLPSLSGLAAVIAMRTKASYLAGIWAQDLTGLVWYADRSAPSRTRCENVLTHDCPYLSQDMTPVWSWASVRGAIRFPTTDHEPVKSVRDPTLVESNISLSTSDPFGKVSQGILTLRVQTIAVTCQFGLNERDKFQATLKRSDDTILGEAWLDCPYQSSGESIDVKALRVYGGYGFVYFLLVCQGAEHAVKTDTWERCGVGLETYDCPQVWYNPLKAYSLEYLFLESSGHPVRPKLDLDNHLAWLPEQIVYLSTQRADLGSPSSGLEWEIIRLS
ncbi:hypothetical protein LTR78_001513 [Recurvomyces mirabilis]|uniref:Heterokaryon incompatibility domain-containing protein n=1 Tax=Recurvomyces mirabilis TaxID=574656 RepID=A0AAE0WW94_9PEZI|nr:hypothetical protein LTR78_001513 [Recurvomyces mirabilis]KAK5161492.1 hypothetical protein LTS14_001288 [Recurvomyces mirabilis]